MERTRINVLWLLLALVGGLTLLGCTLGFGLGYDHGFLDDLAWGVLRHQWPYVDVWDTSFPGGFLFHALVLAVGGESARALRAADLILELGTVAILFFMGRRAAGPRAGAVAAIGYVIAYVAGGYYHTAQRDGFLVPFMLLALWAIWGISDGSRRPALLSALAGVSTGIVLLFRPSYAVVVAMGSAALALAPMWQPRARDRTWGAAQVNAALFGVLSVAPFAVFVAIYAVSGHLHALLQLFTALMTVYAHLERSSWSAILIRLVRSTPKLVLLGALLVPIADSRIRRSVEVRSTVLLLVGCILVRLWESKGFLYQYWPAIACIALLSGIGWDGAARIAERRLSGRATAVLLCVVLLVQALWQDARSLRQGYAALLHPPQGDLAPLFADSPEQAALAGYIRRNSLPSDAIQLWGAEAMMHFATRRRWATRLLDPFLFFCEDSAGERLATECGPPWPRPIQVQLLRELVSALDAHPPRYIVAHYANGSLAIVEGPCAAPDLPELRALIDSRYRRDTTAGNWSVFERIDERAGVNSGP